MLLFIHLGVVTFFIVLGILFLCGKGASLIAGYNTASDEEKIWIDEKKLCRFMGKLMFVLAACWLVAASSEIFNTKALLWTGIALFLAVIVCALIYANTGHRFEKEW